VLASSNVLGDPAGEGGYYSNGRFVVEGLNLVEEGLQATGDIGPTETIPWSQIIDQSMLATDQRIQLPR